jgi:hypothetical protein
VQKIYFVFVVSFSFVYSRKFNAIAVFSDMYDKSLYGKGFQQFIRICDDFFHCGQCAQKQASPMFQLFSLLLFFEKNNFV